MVIITAKYIRGESMKAVILAGGEGTRLRPLSVNYPKPMVSLFEKPVLEHTLKHLKNNEITDIVLTLHTLPHVITDYFGDGGAFGASLSYVTEHTPLGTAGAVNACVKSLGANPFLVISGDGVCDFDLREALRFHTSNTADVTILLSRQKSPQSYGLVMTDESGKVTRFIEKPSRTQVFTDTVNTGIYILNPDIFSSVPPDMPFDFAKDLFPELLQSNRRIFGYVPEGYWCDIGDTEAYLRCTFDALDGKIQLSLNALPVGKGIWSDSAIPGDIAIIPPCYIGADVSFGSGVTIGPYTVISSGTSVGSGSIIARSCIESSDIGERAEIDGAIVCRGASIGAGARLREGCVIGDGAIVGANALIMSDARIWPNKEIDEGARISGSVSAGYNRRGALFRESGCITGQPHVDLTPDFIQRLGSAAAMNVPKGEIALCMRGDNAARLAVAAFETGLTATGRNVTRHDAAFEAAAAYAAGAYRFALTVFVSQNAGEVKLNFFSSDGLPINRLLEQKIEASALRGEVTLRDARSVGGTRTISGVTSQYELAAGEIPPWFDDRKLLHIAARGDSPAERSLYHALLVSRALPRADIYLPEFMVDSDGYTVRAVDEMGRNVPHERLLAILCLFEASRGNTRLAVPYAAPALLDHIGESSRLTVLRPGRDDGARMLLSIQPYMRDGIFMVCRIVHALITCGQTLAALNDALPPFGMTSVELPLENDRGSVMRELAGEYGGELVEGVRAKVGGGYVHIAPIPGRRALRVTAEGASEEYAAELCSIVEKRVKYADGK